MTTGQQLYTKMEGKKRARSTNFTECEKYTLLDIVSKYIAIVENKRTDG